MIHASPFGNMANNNNNSNVNKINPLHTPQSNQMPNLPPSKKQLEQKANKADKNDNFLNPPPPKTSNQQYINEKPKNDIYPSSTSFNNTMDNLLDEEFKELKDEFELKIKPLNCSSEYISTSTNVFPSNIETLNQLSLPISISLCPLKNTGIELPLIDYGEKNIPRCPNRNCRAYINPFIKFIDGGENWICNLCGQINNTEDYYYCDVDKNGIRLDINEKAELCNGSYEFVTNKSYWKKGKTPTEAMFFFIFETSMGAIDNGFFSACLESVKDVINNESFYNGNDVKICIITYNTGVDFYSYNEKSTQPQMLTVNDDSMFLPTNKKNLIFNLKKRQR